MKPNMDFEQCIFTKSKETSIHINFISTIEERLKIFLLKKNLFQSTNVPNQDNEKGLQKKREEVAAHADYWSLEGKRNKGEETKKNKKKKKK